MRKIIQREAPEKLVVKMWLYPYLTWATAALIVFVDTMKELPATLLMRPMNSDTLAVLAYGYASDERLENAALPSLTIVLVGLPALILMMRRIGAGR